MQAYVFEIIKRQNNQQLKINSFLLLILMNYFTFTLIESSFKVNLLFTIQIQQYSSGLKYFVAINIYLGMLYVFLNINITFQLNFFLKNLPVLLIPFVDCSTLFINNLIRQNYYVNFDQRFMQLLQSLGNVNFKSE